ncbi:MAG: O-antigen ligase family protein, partial [Actinobacteria bacterium]|nr:O-antigen ligase family protein [Actinomycetota bacterium]
VVFTVTWAKLQWDIAGDVTLADILTALFLAALALTYTPGRRLHVQRSVAVTTGFFLAFLLLYLAGFYNLETSQALAQWAKGMTKYVLHFLFLIAGVALIQRRGARFFWATLGVFVAGLTANALYGLLQLLVAQGGGNLDSTILSPITGGASRINIYGIFAGQPIFRVNALTGDPNHLGVELPVVLLILLPLYLRMERSNPWRRRLAVILAFCFVVMLSTLSRSGGLGLFLGLLVLLIPYRRHLLSARFLLPLGAVALIVLAVVGRRQDFFREIFLERVSTSGSNADAHFGVYSFIPDVLGQHPWFGLGLNNFAVYYQLITGRTDYGPHSFYVSQVVETGIVGTALFIGFLVYLFRRLGITRRLGRQLTLAGDTIGGARVRPLAWGLTAALVSTIASNAFYLTMSFYYFDVVAMLAIASPVVATRLRP